MLGAFLLPAFTRLGHECQDRLSPCDGSEEGGTRDSASCRAASPTHYRLSYSGPRDSGTMLPLYRTMANRYGGTCSSV